MGSLDGRTAVVTGGGSGIGRASASLLASAGASIVVVDRDGEAGRAHAESLGGLFFEADVSDAEAWSELVASLKSGPGRVDIAHLNAGVVTQEAAIGALTDEQYRRIMGANVDGVVFGVRALAPVMAAGRGGALVGAASLAGLIAFSPDPIYTLTKHAVVGLARALAPQLGESGITINAVCPGLVDTPLLGEQARDLLSQAGFPIIPPEEIAQAVLACVTGSGSGQAIVCQAGAEPVPYRFAGVPGPGGDLAGTRPPSELAAHDLP